MKASFFKFQHTQEQSHSHGWWWPPWITRYFHIDLKKIQDYQKISYTTSGWKGMKQQSKLRVLAITVIFLNFIHYSIRTAKCFNKIPSFFLRINVTNWDKLNSHQSGGYSYLYPTKFRKKSFIWKWFVK